jgi:hypothetical protein
VNHYERLKVSPEAPPEVIRAAYRALAAKLHPDRQSGESRPGDPVHEDMAALNASYLVLMDSKARAEYDETLLTTLKVKATAAEPPAKPGRRRSATDGGPDSMLAPDAADTSGTADAPRIDVGWLVPDAPRFWFQEPKWIVAMASMTGIALAGITWWGIQQAERSQFDRSLSATAPVSVGGASAALAMPAPKVPDPAKAAMPALPSPEQLAKMSDTELLAAMPTLMEPKPVVESKPGDLALESSSSHMLDGRPLELKLAPLHLPTATP